MNDTAPTEGAEQPGAGASDPTAQLGEQAAALLGAVQDWARRNFDLPATAATDHAAHAAVCSWCPLCQFVAVLRGDRPEVTERVAAAGTAVVSALRAMLDAAAEGATTPTSGPDEPRVHKIDLDS